MSIDSTPEKSLSALTSLQVASILKAAGDDMRLQILKICQRDAFGVLELAEIFAIAQPAMSHHLKVLVKAGLIQNHREGTALFYKRVQNHNAVMQPTVNHVYQLVDQIVVGPMLQKAVSKIHSARKEKAQTFFNNNVGRFQEQQDLIAGVKDYGKAVSQLMKHGEKKHWVEVGSGAGELILSEFGNFSAITALDISEALLESCRKTLRDSVDPSVIKTHKFKFLHNDTRTASQEGLRADVVSCNMVLHHTASPSEVIKDMALILKEQGQLLICELVKHDQDWARASCGDLWLGFEPEEIEHWANKAGLTAGRTEVLAMRNGFSVQILEFLKPKNMASKRSDI